jgi:hypothetical protein
MKNKKQDKQLETLLFEVYDKGVKQQDCNLTEYIEKVKQALRIHDVSGRSEQLATFLQNRLGKKYGIYFEQQDIDELIDVANCH